MNKERMLKLAEVIEGGILRVDFDMEHFDRRDAALWGHMRVGEPIPDCGTACCIGGHACLVFGDLETLICGKAARGILGLTEYQAARLFFNIGDYVSKRQDIAGITREEAVTAIRRMVAEEG